MISKPVAIRRYFGTTKEVTTSELKILRESNAGGYHELAKAAAKELGEELSIKKS